MKASFTDLPGLSMEEVIKQFQGPIKDATSAAKSARAAFSSDPENQAKAFEAQRTQGNLDRMWQTLSAILEQMAKTLQAIIQSIKG